MWESGPWGGLGLGPYLESGKFSGFLPVSLLARGPASSCLWPPFAIPAADKRVGRKSQTCPGAEGCARGAGRVGPPHAGPPRLGDSHSRFWAALCFGIVIRGWQMLWGTCPTLLCQGADILSPAPAKGLEPCCQSPTARSASHWPSSL